jgi:hypothetical protein
MSATSDTSVNRYTGPITRRSGGLAVAADQPHDVRPGDGCRPERERDAGGARQARAVDDEKRALGAVVAAGDRARVEERHQERAREHEHENAPHQPAVAGVEPTRRVREDQRAEGDERDAVQEVAERERQRGVRQLERPDRPEQPDREHLGARPVLRAGRRGERAGNREAETGEHRDHDFEARVLEVAGDDEHDRARIEKRAETDGRDEPAAAHRSSERMAEPESSAFEMNPRAPLERIIPL